VKAAYGPQTHVLMTNAHTTKTNRHVLLIQNVSGIRIVYVKQILANKKVLIILAQVKQTVYGETINAKEIVVLQNLTQQHALLTKHATGIVKIVFLIHAKK